jgi:hypothetical protein
MTQKEQIQRFDNLVEKLRQTLSSKGKDYASEDVLSNFKESAERIGQKPYEQCLSMISQKVSRLSNLFKQDRKPNNESIQDSILDLIGYSFLLDAIVEEQNKVSLKDKFAEAGSKRGCNLTEEEKSLMEEYCVLTELSNLFGEQMFDAARQDFLEGHWLKEKPTKELTFEDFIVDEIFRQGIAPNSFQGDFNINFEENNPTGSKYQTTLEKEFITAIAEDGKAAGRKFSEKEMQEYLDNRGQNVIRGVIFDWPFSYEVRFKQSTKVNLERTQAELMQRILLLSLINQSTRSEKDKQELIKYFDELISVTEKLGEDTTELKQEREKLNG